MTQTRAILLLRRGHESVEFYELARAVAAGGKSNLAVLRWVPQPSFSGPVPIITNSRAKQAGPVFEAHSGGQDLLSHWACFAIVTVAIAIPCAADSGTQLNDGLS